jgi:hypothetical protein
MEKTVGEIESIKYAWRITATIAFIAVYSFINFMLSATSTLVTGKIAGSQFESSDVAYLTSQFGMRLFGNLGIHSFLLICILVALWWKPIKKNVKEMITASAVLLIFGASLSPQKAYAYYDKMDYTEAIFILPNESAFFIPDVGDNKTSQTKFGSEAYLEEKKIPAKRFVIPHAKFSGSGTFTDYYVPAGRLIVVDRTPYNREWVQDAHRGTSTKNESFPCQSSEGINVTVEMAVSSSVEESNASKFLYNFGVKPPTGNRSDPQVTFTSVYYGKSLAEVMDGVGRGAVQTAVCGEVSTRTVDKVNSEADVILKTVNTKAKVWFDSKGITLDYIGWAGTFTFDHDVQDAINRVYVANKQALVAKELAPYTEVLQALATADSLRTFANKSDGKLPTTLSLWSLPDVMTKMFSGKEAKLPVTPKQ